MEKSFGLLFILRKPKGQTKGEGNVYLKLTVDSVPVEISTKRKCDSEKWNAWKIKTEIQITAMYNRK